MVSFSPSSVRCNMRVFCYDLHNLFQVSHPETNELLAVKKVDLPDEDDDITEGYLNEVQMLENLHNCDVIIRIFDQLVLYNLLNSLNIRFLSQF